MLGGDGAKATTSSTPTPNRHTEEVIAGNKYIKSKVVNAWLSSMYICYFFNDLFLTFLEINCAFYMLQGDSTCIGERKNNNYSQVHTMVIRGSPCNKTLYYISRS